MFKFIYIDQDLLKQNVIIKILTLKMKCIIAFLFYQRIRRYKVLAVSMKKGFSA